MGADRSTDGTDGAGAARRRRSVHVDAFSHANPVPAASRIGPWVFSGAITGRDPVTREMPPDLDTQCRNVFGHIRAIVAAAGGTTDDIIKVTVWLRDPADRHALNREWVALFPDADDRPARHALPGPLDGPALVQADFVAVLE